MNMKKLIMTALVALLALPVFAQSDKEPLYTSSNGQFTFDLFDHLGFGYNAVKSADFKPAFSCDFFMNMVKAGLFPVQNLGLELGVDFEFNGFSSNESAFMQTSDGTIKAASFPVFDLYGSFDKKRSNFSVFALSAPVLVKGIFDKVEIGVGAVASWNFTGTTSYYLRTEKTDLNYTERKAKVNPFSYGILATVSYDEFGVFFKYYPKSSHLLPEGSVDLSFMTVGIAISL